MKTHADYNNKRSKKMNVNNINNNKMRALGNNPMRRARSMALLNHTLEQMNWDSLYNAVQTSPELEGLIRAHVYHRLQANPRRMAYLDTMPLQNIIDQQIRIQAAHNRYMERMDIIMAQRNQYNTQPLPVARCLFPDEIKEEKDNKTP